MEEQTNEALWYVVHTYSGYENKVANDLQTMVENRHLQDLICDIKVPTEMVPEIKDGKERMVEHKLFPNVLVKLNPEGCIGAFKAIGLGELANPNPHTSHHSPG